MRAFLLKLRAYCEFFTARDGGALRRHARGCGKLRMMSFSTNCGAFIATAHDKRRPSHGRPQSLYRDVRLMTAMVSATSKLMS